MAEEKQEQPTQEAGSPSQTKPTSEKFAFTAEIRKLLDILVHALYTHKEIFLRELISNASDALDKVHVKTLLTKDVRDENLPLEIFVKIDKDKKMITVEDSGVGMTKQELIENIGTIAHSGSRSFLEALSKQTGDKKPDFNLIGQFGVGFYSVFMVAERVEILTLSANKEAQEACLWSSDGSGEYDIVPAQKEKRGTEIRVFLKKDAEEFLDNYRLQEVIHRYSDFINYPIKLEDKQVNKLTAIWTRTSSEVKPEEYDEFYAYLTHSTEKPLAYLHLSFDAPLQFRSILFVPRTVPWELKFELPVEWRGVHLYAKRVFIQANCEDLLPPYLKFVRGVVESDDIPLNISRETLQENQVIIKIRKNLVRKVLEHLETLSHDKKDDYLTFWGNFGKFLKQGYRSDYENREKLVPLFRFNSSACKEEKELIPLQDYLSRLCKGQNEIYYISGEHRAAIEKSPHLEMFKRKGVEVIYLTEPIDDFLFEDLKEYQGKKFVSIDREDLSLEHIEIGEEKKEEAPKPSGDELSQKELDDLVAFFKEKLKDRATNVRISKRLIDSPCCLVTSKEGVGVGVQKFIKLMDERYEMPKRILELNPNNTLIKTLAHVYAKSPQEEMLTAFCHQLFDNALLLEGSPLDTRSMVPRMQEMMVKLVEFLMAKA